MTFELAFGEPTQDPTDHDGKRVSYTRALMPPGALCGFSTRCGGVSPAPWESLNLGLSTGDAPENVRENHRRFLTALGLDPLREVCARQDHGTAVRICTEQDAGKGVFRQRDYTADALVTNVPGLPLTVFSADCGTILLYDPVQKAVGAIHAGWRGCAAGVIRETVQAMERAYGTHPRDIYAALGPCIGACCFETDGDVPAAMTAALGEAAAPFLHRQGEKWKVDLPGLDRQWLLHLGVAQERIGTVPHCTACFSAPRWYWSHRRMGQRRGLQGAVIALEVPS